ncbi:EamA family transporter, partial [Methylobacterium radiotolerans]
MNRFTLTLVTALAPAAWGTTYLVTTENALDSSQCRAQAGSMNRFTLTLVTALAPAAWGTTYLVTTE